MKLGFASFGVQLGENTRIDLSTYAADVPIVDVRVNGCSMTLTLRGDVVDDTGLALAHQLRDAVNGFVAECERLHAEQGDRAASSESAAA
ncbi:hypothetical protein [Actinomadura sp. 6N118]|uniref:hypothetical protein n=1 Tax=Actinomadura sp. 6N118 TaxID=3375151 RepID=UPI00378C6610